MRFRKERRAPGVDDYGEIGQGRKTFVILLQEFYTSVTHRIILRYPSFLQQSPGDLYSLKKCLEKAVEASNGWPGYQQDSRAIQR